MLNTVDGYTNELANRTGICAISYYGAVLLNAISQRGPASRPYYRLRRTSFPKLSIMTTTESDGLPGAVLMGCQVRLVSVVVSAGAMLAAYVLPTAARGRRRNDKAIWQLPFAKLSSTKSVVTV